MQKILLTIMLACAVALTGCAEVLQKAGAPVIEGVADTASTLQDGIEAANKTKRDVVDRSLDREEKNRKYYAELQRRLNNNDRQTVDDFVERACKLAPGVSVRLPITNATVIAHCPEAPDPETAAAGDDVLLD